MQPTPLCSIYTQRRNPLFIRILPETRKLEESAAAGTPPRAAKVVRRSHSAPSVSPKALARQVIREIAYSFMSPKMTVYVDMYT